MPLAWEMALPITSVVNCVIDNATGEDREYCYQTTKLVGTGAPADCEVEGADFGYVASEHPDVCSTGHGVGYTGPISTASGSCGCSFEWGR